MKHYLYAPHREADHDERSDEDTAFLSASLVFLLGLGNLVTSTRL